MSAVPEGHNMLLFGALAWCASGGAITTVEQSMQSMRFEKLLDSLKTRSLSKLISTPSQRFLCKARHLAREPETQLCISISGASPQADSEKLPPMATAGDIPSLLWKTLSAYGSLQPSSASCDSGTQRPPDSSLGVKLDSTSK